MLDTVKPYSSEQIHSLVRSLEFEMGFEAVRSRGPGGQNVNKVSSAAIMYWPFEESFTLSAEEKASIRNKLASSINKEGVLYLRSDEHRDLPQNKERCLDKLEKLLAIAFFKPKPRRPSKPTRASKTKKKESKIHRSQIKKGRQQKY